MKELFLFICFLFLTNGVLAQQIVKNKTITGFHPRLKKYEPNQFPQFVSTQSFIQSEIGFQAGETIQNKSNFQSKNGTAYKRVAQIYNGIELLGNHLIIHEKNGRVKSFNGKWLHDFSNVVEDINISEEEAFQVIANYVGKSISELKRNGQNSEPFKRMVFLHNKKADVPHSYNLCYEFLITENTPFDGAQYFVSSKDGKILKVNQLIHRCSTPTQGETINGPSGLVNFSSDDDLGNGNNRLFSCTGSADIHTRSTLLNAASFEQVIDESPEIRNNSNPWLSADLAGDAEAVDVHWANEGIVDYFNTTFGLNSYDGNGAPINSLMNFPFPDDAVNAGYVRGYDVFIYSGHADVGSVTYPDVVAHEFVHAITSFFPELESQNESGAISESWSDILSVAVEAQLEGDDYDWIIADGFGANNGFRNMINPSAFGDPDCYQKGHDWVDIDSCTPNNDNDRCGIHTNAGVGNRWFAVLTEGDEGTNICGEYYDVEGIGLTIATDIAFHAIFDMVADVTFEMVREITIQYTGEEYGFCSPEYIAVINAWHSVCVGNRFISEHPENLASQEITSCSATLIWEDTGAEFYEVCYKLLPSSQPRCETVNTNQIELYDLNTSSPYSWYVAAGCNNILFTGDNNTTTFVTDSDCPTPTDIVFTDISTCSVTAEWSSITGSHGSYTVQIRRCGQTNPFETIVVESNEVCFSELPDDECYEIRISPDCDCAIGMYSDWEPFTLEDCVRPLAPNVEAIQCGFRVFVPANLILFIDGVAEEVSEVDEWISYDSETGPVYFALRNICAGKDCEVLETSPVVGLHPLPESQDPCNIPLQLWLSEGDIPQFEQSVRINILSEENVTGYEFQFRTDPTDNFSEWRTSMSSTRLTHLPEPLCFLEINVKSICRCTNTGANNLSNTYNHVFGHEEFCFEPGIRDVRHSCDRVVPRVEGGFCRTDFQFRFKFLNDDTWTFYDSPSDNFPFGSFHAGIQCETYQWQVRYRCGPLDYDPWEQFEMHFGDTPCCDEIDENDIVVQAMCPYYTSIDWLEPEGEVLGYILEIKAEDETWANAVEYELSATHFEFASNDNCFDYRIKTLCGNFPTCPWESDWINETHCVDCCDAPLGFGFDIDECTVEFIYPFVGYDSVEWDFGDGSTDNGTDVIHDYDDNGTYNVCATVTCENGIEDFFCFEITLEECCDNLMVDFTIDQESSCEFEFTPSVIGDGLSSLEWDFGDGNTSENVNGQHEYLVAGDYQVCLTVDFDNGCEITVCKDISGVEPCCDDVTVDIFPFDFGICEYKFVVGIVSPWENTEYFWDFDDGNTSTESNPTHTYTSNGDFLVCLTITDGGNCNKTECINITVTETCCPDLPVGMNYSNEDCFVQFFAEHGGSGGGMLSSLLWDFGDGNTSMAGAPNHQYAEEGLYNVCLTLFFENGCEYKVNKEVLVGNCCNDYSVSISLLPGPECFIFVPNVSGGVATSYLWEFGDGHTTTEMSPAYDDGLNSQIVVLTVTFEDGCVITKPSQFIFSCCSSKNVAFEYSPLGFEKTFTSTGTGQTPVSWEWDFGDGSLGSGEQVDHTYQEIGVYEVCMTITFASGCIRDLCETIDLADDCAYIPLNPQSCILDNNEITLEWANMISAEEYQVQIFPNGDGCCDGPLGDTIDVADIRENLLTIPFIPCFSWRVRSMCNGLWTDWDFIGELSCGGVDYCESTSSDLCGDGIRNGKETGVDCGGDECKPCICDDDLTITFDVDQSLIYHAKEFIITQGKVLFKDSADIKLYSGKSIELRREFATKQGVELLIDIDACEDGNN